jgi:hypothetical protein
MGPPRHQPTFEQEFLEVIEVAAIVVHGGLRVLQSCGGQLRQEVMGVGGVVLQPEALCLGKLGFVCVGLLIARKGKSWTAGGRRRANVLD